jgi:hypothetical protein
LSRGVESLFEPRDPAEVIAMPAETPAETEVKTWGNRRSLEDLDRVGLEVRPLPSALVDEGIDRQAVTGFMRDLLEKAPTHVISRTGSMHLRGSPCLELRVSLSETDSDSLVYLVVLELTQGVRLERSDVQVEVPTWRAEAVGLTQKSQLATLTDLMSATADAFVTDFAAK